MIDIIHILSEKAMYFLIAIFLGFVVPSHPVIKFGILPLAILALITSPEAIEMLRNLIKE